MLKSDRMSMMDYEYSRNHQQQQFTTSNLCHNKNNGLNDEIKFTTKTCFGKLTPENNLKDVFPYSPIYRGNIDENDDDDCNQILTDILSSSEWILTKDAKQEIEDITEFPTNIINMRDHLRPEFEIILIDPNIEYTDTESSESESNVKDSFSHTLSRNIISNENEEDEDIDSDDSTDDSSDNDNTENEIQITVVKPTAQTKELLKIIDKPLIVNKTNYDSIVKVNKDEDVEEKFNDDCKDSIKLELTDSTQFPPVGFSIKIEDDTNHSTVQKCELKNSSIENTTRCSSSNSNASEKSSSWGSSSSSSSRHKSIDEDDNKKIVTVDINSKAVTTAEKCEGTTTSTQPPERGKRRLNIEEYYKRRRLNGNAIVSNSSSGSCSSSMSTIPLYSTLPGDTEALAIAASIKKEKQDNENTTKNDTENGRIASAATANEYEQIITVSIGCNTMVSIPPNSNLDQITNNLVKSNDAIKLSSNSLIASIQDVIYKKCNFQQKPSMQKSKKGDEENVATNNNNNNNNVNTNNNNNCNKMENDSLSNVTSNGSDGNNSGENGEIEEDEHGENKTIMYLRKDRIRPRCISLSIQTIPTLQFGVLPAYHRNDYYDDDDDNRSISSSRSSYNNRRSNHKNGYHSENGDNSNNYLDKLSIKNNGSKQPFQQQRRNIKSSNSDRNMSSTTKMSLSSSTYCNNNGSDYKRCENRLSRRGSRGRSFDDDDNDDGGWLRNGYDSKYNNSSTKNRKTYGMYRQEQQKQEERCIVYVGRIERHTNKDDLRQKFIRYGPITNITQHHKATGMKFGFITYERAKDAYTVIDSSSCDPAINMYDISFGGRRQFCGASYMDLDGNGDEQTSFAMIPSSTTTKLPPLHEDSFEEMLKAVKERICPNASAASAAAAASLSATITATSTIKKAAIES